ncbi:MAG: LON peptidase substrate-binding domain-containing protein [Aggregatilineales bacterium]
MYELPLFPLSSVLFPGMPINLHIFEERYKTMINECIQNREPFGVILIADGQEAGDPLVQPYHIGCTAQITQVQPLSQGRMQITAVGRERFKVLSLNYEKPYLTGMVENYPHAEEDPYLLRQHSKRLKYLLDRYLRVLEEAGQLKYDDNQLPHDPMTLAYLASVLLQQITMEQKQKLLEIEMATYMIDELTQIYRREVVIIESLLTPPENSEFVQQIGPFVLGPFSLN